MNHFLKGTLMCVGLVLGQFSCKEDVPSAPTPGDVKTESGNTLLKDPVKGEPFGPGAISDFTLASNGKDIALIVGANSTGKVYAIDVADNNASESTANAISDIVNFKKQMADRLGIATTSIAIENMEVNPISKSIYVLVRNLNNHFGTIFAITKGNTISMLDFSSVFYSAVTVFNPTARKINDMTWGDNTLFLSIGGESLAAEIGKVQSPFKHNETLKSKQPTNLFTHGSYQTQAPVEQMVYGKVNNVNRLMGVTTCAPGFSIAADKVTGTGTLDIRQYYDILGGQPWKVAVLNQGNASYLFDLHSRAGSLHERQLIRIGQKYLDETQGYNEKAKTLRNPDGTVSPDVTEQDFKIYPDSYEMIAGYSNTQLLVVTDAGILTLLTL